MKEQDFDLDDVLLGEGEPRPTVSNVKRHAVESIEEVVPEAVESVEVAESKMVKVHDSPMIRLDDSDRKLMGIPGVQVVKFGDHVSRFAVERIKFSANRKTLIAIISLNAIVLKTHYNEDVKSFLCFGGECCENGLPSVRYLFPCFVYSTDDKGKPITKEMTLKALVVGDSAYEQLVDIHNAMFEADGVKLTQLDLLVTCADEQYQKVTFTPAGRNRWQKFEEAQVRELLKKWKDNKATAYRCVAKSIDAKQYRKIMGLDAPAMDMGGSNLDLGDVLGE